MSKSEWPSVLNTINNYKLKIAWQWHKNIRTYRWVLSNKIWIFRARRLKGPQVLNPVHGELIFVIEVRWIDDGSDWTCDTIIYRYTALRVHIWYYFSISCSNFIPQDSYAAIWLVSMTAGRGWKKDCDKILLLY